MLRANKSYLRAPTCSLPLSYQIVPQWHPGASETLPKRDRSATSMLLSRYVLPRRYLSATQTLPNATAT